MARPSSFVAAVGMVDWSQVRKGTALQSGSMPTGSRESFSNTARPEGIIICPSLMPSAHSRIWLMLVIEINGLGGWPNIKIRQRDRMLPIQLGLVTALGGRHGNKIAVH